MKPVTNRMRALKRVFAILEVGRRETVYLLGLSVLYAMLEGFGIGLLMPILQYIENPDVIEHPSSVIWVGLVRVLDIVNLEPSLFTLMALAFLPIILRQFVYYAYQVYSAIVMNRAESRLRVKGFEAVMYSDLSFVATRSQGDLVGALVTQIYRGGQAIQQAMKMLSALVLIVGYIALLLVLGPELTIIAVVVMAVISWLARLNLKKSRQHGGAVSKLGVATQTAIAERLSALRLIKMRGQEAEETRKVAETTAALEAGQIHIMRLRSSLEALIDPVQMLAVFVVLWVGVEVLGTSLASLGLFLFILLRLNGKAREFNISRQTFSTTIDSLEHTQRVIREATASRQQLVDGTTEFEGLKDGIEFKNVGFRYGDDPEAASVLVDVSFDVPRGSLVAMVGRSGAGKSTLVDLIPRLRDVTAGELLVDGVPVQEYRLRSLRRHIGFMTQEAVLFNDSILNNLAYGLEREFTPAEIAAALDASFCTEFVDELPAGLETNVGDRGVRLSGGQRQRLALARTFLQEPDILILDEPTSALDSESEQYIQQALAAIHGTTTMLVIAHRLSTVQRADQILVLEQGRIVERGTHAELLELSGVYRKLFELQIYG